MTIESGAVPSQKLSPKESVTVPVDLPIIEIAGFEALIDSIKLEKFEAAENSTACVLLPSEAPVAASEFPVNKI
jgi:hypothetical protein